MMNYSGLLFKYLFMCVILLPVIACSQQSKQVDRFTNSTHLDHLYEEIRIDDIDMAVIHIYAEHPDYQWVDDDDEGSACIDDAARAAVYYIRDYEYNLDRQSLDKAKKILEFVLYMQDDAGYYYNFIFPGHSVNKDHQNSVNRPGWWSWRALWALTEAYPIIIKTDPGLAENYMGSIRKTVESIKIYIVDNREVEDINGLMVPAWLPYKYAADQASVIIMCLSNYFNITNDESVLEYINILADGIKQMQIKEQNSKYYGAMLSWKNTWHAWGNLQSYSLLNAYQLTSNNEYLESALMEINNFYKYQHEIKYLSYFEVGISDDALTVSNGQVYSQIAYGIRPMVYAAIKAFEITGDNKYALYAAEYCSWFFGKNLQNAQMYFPETGICYDGMSENRINKNSGAESTIEALLALQLIEQHEIAFSTLNGYMNE